MGGRRIWQASHLKEIRFVPRNDGNFIYEGDNYELYYWEKEGWTLLSNIKGTRDGVLFVDNVPQGTLLLLHNATRGREERVFTYENGQQYYFWKKWAPDLVFCSPEL